MLPHLLSIRTLLDSCMRSLRDSLHTSPDLAETLQALRTQLADLLARTIVAMQLTTFSSVYAFVSRWFMKAAKLCIEALDWLLLPRLAWKITVRHCVALMVLYFVKVFYKVSEGRHETAQVMLSAAACLTRGRRLLWFVVVRSPSFPSSMPSTDLVDHSS
jgi:hypothetical protein